MSADTARRRQFKERVYVWSRTLEVDVQSLSVFIRPMERKWASCSSSGNLSFNADLLNLGSDLQDYVIVHELSHLLEANHTDRFWSIIRAHTPFMEKAKTWLKEHGQMLEQEL